MRPSLDHASKYLAHYGEPLARFALAQICESGWDAKFSQIVVVPACAEHQYLPGFVTSLKSLIDATNQNILVMVVLNQHPDASAEVARSNAQTALWVQEYFSGCVENGWQGATSWQFGTRSALMLVDAWRVDRQISEKGGVGEARKVGCDLALGLIAAGIVTSRYIIWCDADVRLRALYPSLDNEQAAALLIPFEHIPDPLTPEFWEPTHLYEQALAYYENGLRRAGSSSAWTALGSAMAVRADAYIAVRGVPKRNAAEDFYMLNKLAKVGKIAPLAMPAQFILARSSSRVPFGTGVGAAKIKTTLSEDAPFCYYDERCFTLLQWWLVSVGESWDDLDAACDLFLSCAVQNLAVEKATMLILIDRLQLPMAMREIAAKSAKKSVRQQHFHIWFDAFRTLKFIHAARELAFADLPFRQPRRTKAEVPDSEYRTGASSL